MYLKPQEVSMNRMSLGLAIIFSFLVLSSEASYGIPAFARKYKTSCATCHNGFPKLTAFGEAFRRNGYQFPGHADPEFIKEEPVDLGAEGNKHAFPDAIWPGSLPGSSPISLFLNGEMNYNPKVDPRFTFDGLGNSIEAVAGGTLGDDLSFWGQVALNRDGSLELNRLFLIFSNLIGDSYALNARVGVIEPGLFSFSTHRAWMEGYWLTTRPFSDDMGWSVEETQKGVELNGVVCGRFGYNAGIVEGFGLPHTNKDYYGHVTYKFDGMPLDGVVEGGPSIGATRPYIDNSLTIGAFVYAGNAVIGPDTASQENRFTEFGADINGFYDRVNLFGGFGIRHDSQPFLGTLATSANTTTWFAEVDVTVFPWLLPGLRFESWKSHALDATGQVVSYSDNQIVPGIVALIRANVKATLRASFAKQESQGDSKWQPSQVALGLSVGI
jgi:hypothetical protein